MRFDGMPYITKVHSLPELAVGTRVVLEIKRIDPLLMEIDTRFKTLEAKSTDATADIVVDVAVPIDLLPGDLSGDLAADAGLVEDVLVEATVPVTDEGLEATA